MIEARVQESGGIPKQESPVERARRLSKRISDDKQLSTFLDSEIGVNRANQEVESLFSNIEEIVTAITAEGGRINPGCKRNERRGLDIYCAGYNISISWACPARNTLHNSRLYVDLSKRDRFSSSFERPRRIAAHKFNFDLRLPDRYGWSRVVGDKRFFTSEQLASHCVELLLKRIQQDGLWKQQ